MGIVVLRGQDPILIIHSEGHGIYNLREITALLLTRAHRDEDAPEGKLFTGVRLTNSVR